MKFPSYILGAVLAGVSIFAGNAHAGVVGTAAATNFQFQLVDLNPDDGITPSVTLGNAFGGHYFYIHGVLPGQSWGTIAREEVNDVGPIAYQQYGVSANGSINPQGSIRLSGGSDGLSARLLSHLGWEFTLTPFTRLLVSADVTLTEHVKDGIQSWGFADLAGSLAGGSAWMQDWVNSLDKGEVSKTLNIAFESDGSETKGNFYASANVLVVGNRNNVAPDAAIPEPASLAIFGLGMGAIAALRRRRNRA